MRFLAPLRQAYKVTSLTYPGRNFLNYAPAAFSWDQTYTRCYGSKSSGNSKFFKNRKTPKKSKRDLSKYKHGSTFKRRLSRSSSNITPVAVITNADHSQKVALIPIYLFEGKRNDEEAFEKALAIVSLLRDHGRQVELFADNCTKLKSGVRRLQSNKTFDKIMPQPSGKTPILTEFEGHDEATFLTKQNKSAEEVVTDYIAQIPAVSFTAENDDLPANIASQLREIPVSGMQLNFEMNMTNVKDALLNPSNLPALPSRPRNLENSTLALSTNVRLDSADTKTVPLHFNALIQGIVEVNPKEFSNDKLTMLKVPQFNEYVTAIAANICSTALQRGFPTDVSRKFYSTNKTPSDNDVTVKNMLERYDQFRNERNARKAQMSKASDGKRFNECHQGNDEVEIYSKFTTAPGLLDCSLYQKSLEVAARKRKEAPNSAHLALKSQKRVTPPKGESGPKKALPKLHSNDGLSSQEPKSTSREEKTISKHTSATVSDFESKGTSACKKTSAPSISDSKNEVGPRSEGSRSSSQSRSNGPCKKASSASIPDSRKEAKGPCKKVSSDSVRKSPCRPCREASLASKSSPRSTAKSPCKKASALKPQGESPCKNASSSTITGSKSERTSPCKTTSSASKSEATSPCKMASPSKLRGEGPCKKASASKSQGKSPCKKASSASISGPKSEGTSPCKTTSSASKPEATSPCKKASPSKLRGESPCKKASASKSQGKSPCNKASSASISGPKLEGTSPCKTTSSASKSEATSPCKKASPSKPRGESPCKKASSASISGPKSEGTSPCKTTSSASKSEATSPCKKASPSKLRANSPCKKVPSALKAEETSPCKKASSAIKVEASSPCKKASSASISGSKSEGTSPCKKASPSKLRDESPCKKSSSPSIPGTKPKLNKCKKASKTDPRKKTSSASLCGSRSKTSPDSKSGTKSQIKCGRPSVGDTRPKCKKASPISKCGSMKTGLKDPCKTSSAASKCGSKKDAPSASPDSSKACKRAAKAKCGSQKNLATDASSSTGTLQTKDKRSHGCTKPKCSDYRCPSCSTTRDVHTLTTLLAPFAVQIDPSSRNYSRKCPDDPKNINKPNSEKSNEYRRETCGKLLWKDTKHKKEHRNKPKNCYPEETREFCPDTACYKASKYSKKGNKKHKENEMGNYKVLCSAAKHKFALLMSAIQRCHQSTNARINQEAIIEAPYKIGMQNHSIPRLFDNDVLVAVDSVALSDSDIYMFETGAKHYQEVTLGNEAAGVVQKIGRNVHHLKIGDHVAIESAIPCRRCDLCKNGHYNLCNRMTFNGCLSKYCIHPGAFCYKISKEIPMERAAMAYQLALGCNVSHQARIKPNSNVAIIGSCAMTVCAAICAHSMGASNICVMCGSANTGNIIEKFVTEKVGCFDGKVNESALVEKILDSLGTPPDIVINCSSCTKTMNAAIMALKPTGTCVIAGFHSECASFNIMDALMKEIRIIPSYRSKNMFPLAINLLESGRAPIDGLISNCCRWDELEAAFRVALSEGNSGPRKVVVQCQVGDGKIKTV